MTLSLLNDCGADLSPDRLYRYRLWRGSGPALLIIGLNPSTADESEDDSTIRRCLSKARSLGLPMLVMCNLFAWRATDPKAMTQARDPVGPDNDAFLLAEARAAKMVLCAWGNRGHHLGRDRAVMWLLRGIPLHVLRLTKQGQPEHPLYLPEALRPIPWEGA